MGNKSSPFYKRWWFWIIVLLVLFSIIGSSNSNPRNDRKDPSVQESIRSSVKSDTRYIIEVTGTQGLEFSGNIGGGGSSRSVDGIIPENYTVEEWPAVAVVQKRGTSGNLSVSISKNGQVLNSQSTTAQYGVVTVSSG